MKVQSMVGYKLFKEVGDKIHVIRIIGSKKFKDKDTNEVKIRDEDTGEIKKVPVNSLEGYTPLEPDGYLTFNIVEVANSEGKLSKDIIVTGSKILNMKIGDKLPFVVCRQSITDIFYNLLCNDESKMIVGLSVNQNNCPTNFRIENMLACNNILYSENVNFYRIDTLEDIYQMINLVKYDDVLYELYEIHTKYSNDPMTKLKYYDGGWCRNLRTLLKYNNFQTDIDEMLGITSVDFKIEDYLIEAPLPGKENETYMTVEEYLRLWLSITFKINIGDISVLIFAHDIDLADFNNSRYLLIRDNTKTLYFFVYTLAGEFFEKDLEEKTKELDFSSKFRLDFYNKYKGSK